MTNKTKGWLMLICMSIIVYGFIFYIAGFYTLLICIAMVIVPICVSNAITLIEREDK